MSKTAFKEFVEQEREKTESWKNSIHWEGRKQSYLNRIEELLYNVEKFLGEFTESNDIQIKKRKKKIQEEFIGQYEVPVLRIQLFGKQAALIPVGTLIIGTPGRVDLVGPIETKRIILTDKDKDRPQPPVGYSCLWLEEDQKLAEIKAQESQEREFVWKIITDPPDIHYIELNKDSFLSSLQEVLDA